VQGESGVTVQYKLKWVNGKYFIYKLEHDEEKKSVVSTTLAKGLDRETAEGMMKLLKEPQ
jgi:hypothetical protein